MFYLHYLKSELVRRWGKTLTISLGLAIASAIIISIISLSQSLSKAQDKVLNPLGNVGTDIMVSRSVNANNMRDIDQTTRNEVMNENRISTDLSKLGNPGDQFSNDTFQSGTMLSFGSDVTKKLTSNVKDYAQGLILTVTHQEGKIPKVTSTFETGGETLDISGTISPDEMQKSFDEAQTKAMEQLKSQGIDPNSDEGRKALRQAIRANMPAGNFRKQITTERKTITQDVGPISTDIQTTNFTVAGVDINKKNIGLILPTQITSGKYFSGSDQMIVNQTFAEKNSIKVGNKYKLGGKEFTVAGLVDPKLYTNTADLYIPLTDLQKLANRTDKINILLVKSTKSDKVAALSTSLGKLFTGAKITDSSDTAKEVSGSLVSAANLTNRFIGITSIIVVLAAFVIVSLLTVLSVNKRTREIGTLKAIGWNNSTIVRQILMENVLIGVFGAIIGVGLGILGIYLLNRYNISLSASIENSSNTLQGMMRRFGPGASDTKSSATTASIALKIGYSYLVLGLGAGIAIVGSILAGGLAAFKSSRMRAQEALRNLE